MSDAGPETPLPEEPHAEGALPSAPVDERRSLGSRLADRPVPTALAAALLAAAVVVGAVTVLGDDGPEVVSAPASTSPPSPSPTASASPTPVATTPAPTAAAPDLDPSCTQDAVREAVCRFVLALRTGDDEGLTAGERELAGTDTDLPDAPFSVSSCDLEGDVTVLCEVQFTDPERIAAGFRLVPANGEYDAATGQVVVAPGESLRYEVVEAVGMRRGEDPAPSVPVSPEPAAPAPAPAGTAGTGGLVLDGDDLGVTRVGAPYREAVRAVAQVLGPPTADPSGTVACVGAEQLEVEWPQLRLAVTDDRVSGWITADRRLRTPSGVRVGTTVAELRRTYGERLRLFEASPDAGPGFTVDGVELGGDLDTAGRVSRLWNRACAPP